MLVKEASARNAYFMTPAGAGRGNMWTKEIRLCFFFIKPLLLS